MRIINRGRRLAVARWSFVVASLGGWASVSAMTPLGPPTEVAEDADFEVWHAVASAPDGRTVTVWLSGNRVRAQRFSESGAAIGTPLTISAAAGGEIAPRNEPAVTMDSGGNFTVVWSEVVPTARADARHLARRFRFDGSALTGVVVVDERALCGCGDRSIPLDFMAPVIAGDAAGNFAVAWREQLVNGVDQIYLRRHAADGQPLGAAMVVNSGLPLPGQDDRNNGLFPEGPPSIASNADGELLVAWGSNTELLPSVQARRYRADGVARGLAKRVANVHAEVTSAALDASGRFVVAWSEQTDGRAGEGPATTFRTRFRRYGAAGLAAGAAQDLPDAGGNDLTRPRLAMDASGNFVLIAWRFQQNTGIDSFAIKPLGQRYRADGTPDGPTFRYGGENPSDGPLLANVAAAADGRIAISWFNQRLDRDFSNPLATTLRVQRFTP